ncbi:flagellin [Saccharospirillum sp. HFRX-1]|uniref:flagellin N-terminal helical domain-containing protein n=1 Tax=unclassified Saccharospirillum TaxID=2633430 RepID=UPI00371BF474
MPQIINTNMASLTAQRNLNNSQSANSTALERLSSGLRINSAKDDAAGLAISTRFESQTRGLGVAIRNAGDGISLAQTAEGALGAMTENLQRIRDLANQSVNTTNNPDDRIALQAEVEQRIAELRRTAEDTNFNGRKLLDGNFSGTFQIGANAGETVDVQIAALTVDRLGSDAQSGVSSYGTDEALGNGDLIINGIAIGPSQSGDDTSSVSNAEASAIAKVATINRYSDQTGVEAFVNANEVNGAAMQSTAAQAGTLTINGVDIDVSTTTNSNDSELASTRAAVMAAINAKAEQTGVRAVDSGSADNGVILVAEDGRNITITNNAGSTLTAAGTGLDIGAAGETQTETGGFTLVANGATKEIVIGGGDGTGNGDLANAGLQRGTYDRATAVYTNEAQSNVLGTAGTVVGTTATMVDHTTAAALDTALKDLVKNGALQDGDIIINGVTIGASSALDDRASDTNAVMSDGAASGIAIAAAINRASESTGVYAKVNETVVVGGNDDSAVASTGAQMDLWINNVDIGTVTSQGDRQQDINTTVGLINSKSGQTGVVAEFNGKSITLTAADGRNISVFALADSDSGTAAWGLDSDVDGIGGLGTSGITFTSGVVGASIGFASAVTAANASSAAIAAATLSNGQVFVLDAAGGAFSGGIASALIAETTHSTVTLESSREIMLEAGTAGTEGLEDSGFIRGTFGNGEDGMFLSEIDISTAEGAEAALTAIDNALDAVNSQRADLGALQNRFESTVSNLQISQENLTAANSRIRDADFAAETAELSRTQVLQQAGISVLAQANQRPQQVLSLLG